MKCPLRKTRKNHNVVCYTKCQETGKLMPRFGQPGKSMKNSLYKSVAGANIGTDPNAKSSTVLNIT